MHPQRNVLNVDRPHRSRGQSVAEFAVILPVMLALFGAAVDFSRLYNSWINLEAATRDAAEYAATKTTTQNSALTESRRIICTAFGKVSTCTDPTVTVTFSLSTTAAGASARNPIATVGVTVSTTFRTLYPYPYFTNGGALTLGSSRTYAIVQGK
ncbi:MAG: TadE/TadG family type IV pilus assembly protein [Chloroflexota bacterium]